MLLGGVYAAASCAGPAEAAEALSFAATAPAAGSVAAVTGAMLGAVHGVHVWPLALLNRLELVWVMDTLARDLVAQLTENPSGSAYGRASDPSWFGRYPGW
ncbi:hypothetical protein [Nonomuraea aridisoli]|uniref:hypothetical protein n=1 Tax=Nonomuraea aridisoli TaxID=2070368 RepID=UPI001C648468|nr:hypothetical protein [Nonomuraea aridisoli]